MFPFSLTAFLPVSRCARFCQSCTRLKLRKSQGALQVEKAVFTAPGGVLRIGKWAAPLLAGSGGRNQRQSRGPALTSNDPRLSCYADKLGPAPTPSECLNISCRFRRASAGSRFPAGDFISASDCLLVFLFFKNVYFVIGGQHCHLSARRLWVWFPWQY